MPYVFSLLVLAAMVFAVVDIITRDDAQIRLMPKALWLILVILVPLVGVILWFVLGREHDAGSEPVVRMPRPQRSQRPSAPATPPAPPLPGGGVGAVPEPGVWALMILGFGAVGAMLRRRRGRTLDAAVA